jgi:hypothetical protein
MRWVEGLKIWNARSGGVWCIPRKGTKEYAEVRKILDDAKAEAAAPREAPAAKPKKAAAAAKESKEDRRIRRLLKHRFVTKDARGYLRRPLDNRTSFEDMAKEYEIRTGNTAFEDDLFEEPELLAALLRLRVRQTP